MVPSASASGCSRARSTRSRPRSPGATIPARSSSPPTRGSTIERSSSRPSGSPGAPPTKSATGSSSFAPGSAGGRRARRASWETSRSPSGTGVGACSSARGIRRASSPSTTTAGPRVFAAAPGAAALLAAPDVPRRLDELRVAAYLVPGLESRTATFYEGILRLPPGHCLSVTPDGGTPRPYWQLDPDAGAPARVGRRVRGAVQGAVHRRRPVPAPRRVPGRRRAERRSRFLVRGVRRPGRPDGRGNRSPRDLHGAIPHAPALRRGRLRRRRRGGRRSGAAAPARGHARPSGRSRERAPPGGGGAAGWRLLHALGALPRRRGRRNARVPGRDGRRPRRLPRHRIPPRPRSPGPVARARPGGPPALALLRAAGLARAAGNRDRGGPPGASSRLAHACAGAGSWNRR